MPQTYVFSLSQVMTHGVIPLCHSRESGNPVILPELIEKLQMMDLKCRYATNPSIWNKLFFRSCECKIKPQLIYAKSQRYFIP